MGGGVTKLLKPGEATPGTGDEAKLQSTWKLDDKLRFTGDKSKEMKQEAAPEENAADPIIEEPPLSQTYNR